MKRFGVWMLCVLTAALLAFAAAASAEETTIVASGTCGKSDNGSLSDNLTWTLDSDGLLTISGEGEMYDATYDTDVQWYSYREQIKSVKIDEDVTSIGKAAFYNCTNLTQINLPTGITSIPKSSFYGCTNLAQIDLPASITIIGYDAFYGCTGLTQIELPENVTLIDGGAFYGCTDLEQVGLPAGLTSIGSASFSGCARLTQVNLPESVASIGDHAFEGCASLKQIKLPVGITYISWNVFSGCTGLTQIELPAGLESIYSRAFENCTSLEKIELPESITSLGNRVFSGCTSLTQINIPSGVTSIGDSVFSGCTGLTQINLPADLKSISNSMLYGCTSLMQIKLPSGVTSIGDYAFYGCTSLKQIELPSRVTRIGTMCFAKCKSLATASIPQSVAYIGNGIFSECIKLESVILPKTMTVISDYMFYRCANLVDIDVPIQVERIGREAFNGCNRIRTINIPDGVTNVGYGTFANCTGLVEVFVPKTVESIDSQAFYKCVNLKQINLPESVTSIGSYAFLGCTDLRQIALPESITAVNSGAFDECRNLKYVVIYAKDGLTSIDNAFTNTNATFYCWEYYYAESWARENDYTVKLLDDMLDADGNIDWSAEEKSVYLEPTHEMICGAAARLYRAVFPFDANWQWSSSNPEIVSVDENGVVTALQNGEADITLTLGDVSATCHVTVYTPVTSFELSRSEMYVVAKKTGRLSVVSAQPENHNDSFAWSSSNESYATVDQEGTVTGKAIGDATITVTTQNGVTRECLVHVCYPVTAVKFAEETVNIHMGGTKQLTANVTMRTMSCVNQLVTFASSDLAVATVDEYGVVTAVGAGTATITAATEDGGISAACEIAVTDEHEIVTDAEIPATRKQTGLTEGAHCAVCGEVLKAQQVIAPRTDLVVAELPAETKTVLAEAFAGSDVECVVLSSACETIGSRAFADCAQLALIEIPEGVTSIADNAFEGSASVALVVKDGSYAQSYAERLGLKWRAE